MLLPSVEKCLDELSGLLGQLTNETYAKPCPALSHASIGEHTRHILEMFQGLLNSYASGEVNYDNRRRDLLLQTDTACALSAIASVKMALGKPDRKITLRQVIDGEELSIESNYYRELLYNLEHCIHHQALIKVAVLQCDDVLLGEEFGVARSTIEYRKQCAQ
ncbi:DinB family protein [Flavobacterium longum]|uniref:DinB family protein n=1 Tax=Flavobacterium longum TaxID=1299340 RepID=UPI0039EA80A2